MSDGTLDGSFVMASEVESILKPWVLDANEENSVRRKSERILETCAALQNGAFDTSFNPE